MISIGLDLSLTATGFSKIENDKVVVETIKTNKNKAKDDSQWTELDRYRWIAKEILKRIPKNTDIIFIEDIFIHSKKERAGSSLKLIALGFIIRYELNNAGFRIVTATAKQIKVFATSKGGASKDMMINSASVYGVVCKDDNQADAFHLANMGRAFWLMFNRESADRYNSKQKEIIRKIYLEREMYNFE